MNKTELAALLNGREYRQEITEFEQSKAKIAGLVVVFGASDDLMEFRGEIYDEIGCNNGGTAYLTKDGLLEGCDNHDCPHYEKAKAKAAIIEALWCEDASGNSWTYRTDIPHETFQIFEDGEPYCRGIVFALADVKEAA